MTFPPVWLEDEGGWQELAGVTRVAIDEQHAYQPALEAASDAPGFLTDDRRPAEQALAILAPHLDHEPLYQPTKENSPCTTP